MPKKSIELEDQPLWYKDAIIYELHVKTFFDSNNDGIGDFKGLTQKLDYLEGLGITAIWLLPFYPSPLKDDGYDIADYLNIHSDYGKLRDFEAFLKVAHERGIRVITELVLNHTSDQHAWFQRARKAKSGSSVRDFYVWSDTPDKYRDARIIFKDFETSNWAWDPAAKAYYWHRFYSHQPDLNYNSPEVQKSVLQAVEHWLKIGVDGLRLDAVPYLFEREGTNCENLPETHAFLKKLRGHVDSRFKDRMLLAEANQWPEDAVTYFGHGDECHMAFHFPLMPRMFMAVQMEDRFPILDILDQTPPIPESCQWALFLRNHDELTLEMVTDEERDYMYRVYARDPSARINLGIRRRLAPLLENDRRKIELMNILLFSLPGTPVIYYGDEIGMGDNYYLGDRNGVRTPMQWSADRNAGFSRANPHRLYLPINIDPEYHYEAVNVETQERNQASLLWWMKRMIAVRKQLKPLGRGTLEYLLPDNSKVLAFIRRYQNEKILVTVNLSRHPQLVELDLSRCAGCVPEEVLGRTRFPRIKDSPYILTLGPYGYYLFSLQEAEGDLRVSSEWTIPDLGALEGKEALFHGKIRLRLEQEVLPFYIKKCPWFGGRSRILQQVRIWEQLPLERDTFLGWLVFLEVQYTEGLPESYIIPFCLASGEEIKKNLEEHPLAAIARLKVAGNEAFLYDGIYHEPLRQALLLMIARRQRIKGGLGELVAYPGQRIRKGITPSGLSVTGSQVLKSEQSNSSWLYGNLFFFKLYRRLDEGINPDLEIGRFLTEKQSFPNIPPFAGTLEYRRERAEPLVIGMLQGYIPNQGDAWRYTLDELARYFERVISRAKDLPDTLPMVSSLSSSPLEAAYQEIPLLLQEMIGGVYLEMSSLLGKRTAELHLALSSETDDPAFTPEPYTQLYQRSVYQSMQSLARKALHLLKKNLKLLPSETRKLGEEILKREKEMMDRFRAILKQRITGMRTRIHGDYHLGQVLYTGNDFIIIDLEGEPAKPLSERRLKRSPLRDVAGMLRSFHYAAHAALLQHASLRKEDLSILERWAELWHLYTGGAFLRSYLETAGDCLYLPKDPREIDTLLNAYILHKAVYELDYELNNRPDWVMIPLRAIKTLLEAREISPLLMEIRRAYPLGIPSP